MSPEMALALYLLTFPAAALSWLLARFGRSGMFS